MTDRPSPARAEAPMSQVLESGVLGLARDLVRALNVALKTVRIHDMKNEAAIAALDTVAGCLNDLYRVGGGFMLKVVGDYFFWNETRLKADAMSYASFDSLSRDLRSKGIGSLTVHLGVDREAVVALVTLINTAPVIETESGPGDAAQASRFLQERLAASTRAFEIGPYRPYEMTDVEREQIDHKEKAKKTFFRAVAVTRAIMTTAKIGQQTDLRRAKRVVQTMVDLILEEEFSLLGLTTIKQYDNYTFFHSVNVCVLAIALGKRLGLDKKRLSELGVAALFHDIGKTEIPATVTNKPGKFDRGEWELMRTHPALGVRVLVKLRGFSDLAMKSTIVAFEHHLGFDLSGYPGLLNARVPHLFSRIVTVADCFDAMTTQRIYSEAAKPRDKALSYMLSQAGKLFDSTILKQFVNLIGIHPIGCLVELSSGQLGVVIATHESFDSDPRRPIVKILTDANGIEIDGPTVDLLTDPSGPDITRTVDPSKFNVDIGRYFL